MREPEELRAWVYVRDYGVRPAALAAQTQYLLEQASRRRIHIVGSSRDLSRGKTLDRAGLRQALQAVQSGSANALFAERVTRLSEDPYVLLRVMEILQDRRAVLVCAAEETYERLRGIGLSQLLYQRAFCSDLDLPWLCEEEPAQKGAPRGPRDANEVDNRSAQW